MLLSMTNKEFKDDATLTGRITRYGRVSGTMAKLATRLAGEKFLGLKIDQPKHAAELVMALGNLKGPLMKVGQILATIPEALPPEYATAFLELQANAPPMGWPFVKRRMKTELGDGWEEKFKSFGHEAAAAASLGQVHRAVLHDGRDVACKLQYPDMASAVEADLRQLQIIFSLYERYDKAISTKLIHQELSARLAEELDYVREAKHGNLYRTMLKDVGVVHVPEIIPELSTKRLLTSTWLQGEKILSFVDAKPAQRNQLALNMFHAWYVPFYNYGVIHGDPHLGNYSVRKDNSINLLDFGCVRVFEPKFVGGVIDLYNALLHDDRALAVHAYETWGFKKLNKDQIDTLTIWAKFLYGPLMEDRVRPIGEVKQGVYGRETAEQVHKKLREVGGVTVPREFVFMDRAALGLGSVFLHLKAEVNWYRVFNELITDFSSEAMQKRQTAALKSVGL
jgi:predicted unusual protein kinase regulating ubiquinone biosynthesis (AarF/ABC1/UbiB family)